MLKKLMITTAVGGLMIGAAAAEGTGPASQSPAGSPPAASQSTPAPAARSSSEVDKTTPAPATKSSETDKSGAGASTAKFINSQQPDQFLASKFKGTDVLGPDNEKIGDVRDILFDKSGKIQAYVVGVGGFLGIGSKDVALEPSAFQIVSGDKSKNESDKLKVGMSKDQLKQAANFEPYAPPRSTTGMGGGTPRPAPAAPMGAR